jgi:hypothetical protein
MASNSRYAVRDREGDLGYDEVDYEVDYEDDLGYFMDAEEADHDMEVEDVEQGGSGDEDEGSDGSHEGEDPEDPEGETARVITLDELREWTDGKFPRNQVKCKLIMS